MGGARGGDVGPVALGPAESAGGHDDQVGDHGDAARLTGLWRAAGLRFRPDLVERDLEAVLARDLVLVDEEAGELTGTVFGSYDGRRGWVHRLATRPDRRGQGIATSLVAELERRLRAAGCPKVNLLIEPDNAAVAGFYARLGYRPDDLLFMAKWLVPEPEDIPNGPGDPSPAPGPAPEGWRDIRPELSAEPYVFAAGELQGPPAGVSPFAVIREDQGVTLILTKADADRAAWPTAMSRRGSPCASAPRSPTSA